MPPKGNNRPKIDRRVEFEFLGEIWREKKAEEREIKRWV
jgi:hypothetical protein